jgi:hypothetical protein
LLTLTSTIVWHNYAGTLGGGGVYNSGTLLIKNSTIAGNSTDYQGGGIFNNGMLRANSFSY